ncbi:MAG: twin-arginine translocation signal domain-containing protein, partial [Myxococcales bacterium]|nr:twin-arginine translocation signal domain-containing protein [Myxococcales bacterium]
MNRRDFLKALGLGGTVSAASACTLDDNVYFTPVEKVLPFVTRPEQTTPGTNSHFATTIGTGPRAWPVVSVHRDGRVINVGANDNTGVARAVTAANLFELQRHWSPDRVTAPRKDGAPTTWDDATKELVGKAVAARSAGKKVAYVGPYRSGTIVDVLKTVTSGNALFFEPLGLDAEALAAKALFGDVGLPRYLLDDARMVLSFGAPFLGDAYASPGLRASFAAAKSANHGNYVARFVAVTPVKDQTAANADDWHGCVPGTEAMVALAIAKLVADAKHYAGPATAMLAAANVEAAASASGISAETIQSIAKAFAAESAVALPGGINGASAAATRLAGAVYLLNHVSGHETMRPGGYRGPISSLADVQALVADMQAGKVGVLLLDDVDLVHAIPGGAFAAALANVGTVVSVTGTPNETNAAAKLWMPTHDAFEDWGDEE